MTEYGKATRKGTKRKMAERKRKKQREQLKRLESSPVVVGAKSDGVYDTINEPYPTYPRPTPDECRTLRDDLMALHGFPEEFAEYRKRRRKPSSLVSDSLPTSECNPFDDGFCFSKSDSTSTCNPKESVLDGLVRTLLSQNTTEANSQRAFASLKSAFPTWEHVLAADSKCIENAIRCGGLAATKACSIKNILSSLFEKRGKICLEYLRDMSVAEIKAELYRFRGIGPKTVACVLMFHLQQDDFPVDTHVFRITKSIGWTPAGADRNKAYLHLNRRIPNELKFDLNCLLVTHGKFCQRCTKKGRNQQTEACNENSCPLSSDFSSTKLK